MKKIFKPQNGLLWLMTALALSMIGDFAIFKIMRYGIDNFYGLNQHSQILIIGHSHLMLATDKESIEKNTGMKVSKYTREGVNVSDRAIMVKQFFDSEFSDSLKLCLYGVDQFTFTGNGLSQNSYTMLYPFMDNENISNYIKSYADPKDYWTHKLMRVTRFKDDVLKNAALRGWTNDWSNKKNGIVDIDKYKESLKRGTERKIEFNPELMSQFKETVSMLTDHGVKVILVNTPTLDLLNQYEPDKYAEIIEWYTKFAETNEMVEYWDFNPVYSSNHDIFHDRLHVNSNGQKIINDEIISKLQTVIKPDN